MKWLGKAWTAWNKFDRWLEDDGDWFAASVFFMSFIARIALVMAGMAGLFIGVIELITWLNQVGLLKWIGVVLLAVWVIMTAIAVAAYRQEQKDTNAGS